MRSNSSLRALPSIIYVLVLVNVISAGGDDSNSGSSSSSSSLSSSGPSVQTCTDVMRLNCTALHLPVCGPTQWPNVQGISNPCCPNFINCRFSDGTCPEAAIRACGLDSKPVCAAGTEPVRTGCCPDCRRDPISTGQCTTDPSQLPRCAVGVTPIILANGCVSCRPKTGRVGDCLGDSVTRCASTFATLPSCGLTSNPERQSQDQSDSAVFKSGSNADSCCLQCRPQYNRYCNDSTIAACRASYSSLPTCTSGQPAFVLGNCCRQCKRPIPEGANRPLTSGLCALDILRACLRAAPVCQDGEQPFVDSANFCCPECRRAERLCTLEDVARCRAATPTCGPGELPVHLPGECCASCAPMKASCTCDTTTQVCVYARDVSLTPTCAPKKMVTITIAATTTNNDPLSNPTSDQLKHLLLEMLARFCEQNRNAALCLRRASQLRNTDASAVVNADGTYTITITYPDLPDDTDNVNAGIQSAAPRFGTVFVASDPNGGIYFTTASDADAGSGYTTTDDSNSSHPTVMVSMTMTIGAIAGSIAMVHLCAWSQS